MINKKLLVYVISILYLMNLKAQQIQGDVQGKYFSKKKYVPSKLYKYDEVKSLLPSPIYEEKPEWIDMYWKAWELAFRNFYEPTEKNGFVSQYADAAFNKNIFMWDGSFITMFCTYGMPYAPGISTLDNMYIKQHEDGEICREISRETGIDYKEWINSERKPLFSRWGWEEKKPNEPVIYKDRKVPTKIPYNTIDALDNPIMAWAEVEYYKHTVDKERLKMVYESLKQFYYSLKLFLRQGNGLYMTDWASMDNSPRNAYLKNGGTCIDLSSQMAQFARNLSFIADKIGKQKESKDFNLQADSLSVIINKLMWDENDGFYYDLTLEGTKTKIKTVAAFWSLIGGVASKEQAARLVKELTNPSSFWRTHLVPTLAADQKGYNPLGNYWQGSVWAPTNTMVIAGLIKYGYDSLARVVALNHLENMNKVFAETGSIWENYAPDQVRQGNDSRKDFVGWSGIGPIKYLLEYAIGLIPDAESNTLTWNINTKKKSGCSNYRFNNHTIDISEEPGAKSEERKAKSNEGKEIKGIKIKLKADSEFNLIINYRHISHTYKVKKGDNKFIIQSL